MNNRLNDKLATKFLDMEVYEVVFEMGGSKAPSPNGFLGSFFQSFYDIIGSEVVVIVQAFQLSKIISRDVNLTFIDLILKVIEANSFSSFMLISLYNFLYKIISKVMNNRLNYILLIIINMNQEGFIVG